MRTLRSLLLLGFLSLLQIAQAQTDTTRLWSIELKDENTFIGKIIEQRNDTLFLSSSMLGLIRIPMTQIAKMEEISPEKLIKGEFWFDNPQSTRYFWAPAGYGLKRGEGYYQNVWIFFNQFSFGITDNTSLGVGFIPLFLFDAGPTPVWLTPKVSFSLNENLHLGGGALIAFVLGEDVGPIGIAYGTATMGSHDKNLSLGLGYGFADGEWARTPAINLSAMIRTGRRGYFLTENYFIGAGDGSVGIISMGGRRVGKVSIDYGGIIPIGEIGGFVVIPWLGISLPLGKAK